MDDLYSILFVFLLPIVSIEIANFVAVNSNYINRLRIRGYTWLDKKPFSCSPCLSFWVALFISLCCYNLLFNILQAFIMPIAIYYLNIYIHKRKNEVFNN